jgi:UDP-perosamine 4-acetyltransferase
MIGSGGHARVVIEILEGTGEFEVIGCVTIDSTQKEIFGYPILGNDLALPELFASGVRNGFVGIGDNRIREQLTSRLTSLGFTMIRAISRHAVLSPRSTIGPGVAIMPGAIVNGGTAIDEGSIVNTGAIVDHDCVIGKYAHVGPGARLAGSVNIGDGTLIGIGATILPGIKIGSGTKVGAGSCVIRDLPQDVTAVGVPAMILGKAGGLAR